MTTEQAIKSLENIVEYWSCKPTEQQAAELALTALKEQQERDKGCVWCKENNKVFHDGQHFHLFCSYCGKRLEVERDG